MYNKTRTDLLNYLNNNKIEYTFDKESQSIKVDLTVTKGPKNSRSFLCWKAFMESRIWDL